MGVKVPTVLLCAGICHERIHHCPPGLSPHPRRHLPEAVALWVQCGGTSGIVWWHFRFRLWLTGISSKSHCLQVRLHCSRRRRLG